MTSRRSPRPWSCCSGCTISVRWPRSRRSRAGALARERIDLVIADMNFSADTTSGEEGEALFKRAPCAAAGPARDIAHSLDPSGIAVRLVKAGAADYVGKPWDNDKLLATVENLLELAESTHERQAAAARTAPRRERLAKQYDLRSAVFESQAMEAAIELACRVARADVPCSSAVPTAPARSALRRSCMPILRFTQVPSWPSIAAPFPPS